jgi:hypothetical protein
VRQRGECSGKWFKLSKIAAEFLFLNFFCRPFHGLGLICVDKPRADTRGFMLSPASQVIRLRLSEKKRQAFEDDTNIFKM